jgi:cytochrome P450
MSPRRAASIMWHWKRHRDPHRRRPAAHVDHDDDPPTAHDGIRRPCLGVHLAPAELIAIITEFLRRIPEFRTADGYSVLAAEVDRYLTHLPLVW